MTEQIPDRGQTAARVAEAVAEMSALIESADRAALEQPAAEGQWRRRDAIAHMVYWHEVCAWALRSTVEGTYKPVDLSDIDGMNSSAAEQRAQVPIDELVGSFRRTGQEVVEAIEAVPDEMWQQKPRLHRWVDGCTLHHYPEHRDQMASARQA